MSTEEEAGAEEHRASRGLGWRIPLVIAIGGLVALVMLLRLHELGPRLEIVSYPVRSHPESVLYAIQITARGGETIDLVEVVSSDGATIQGRTATRDVSSGTVWNVRVLVARDEDARADGAVLIRQRGRVDRDYDERLRETPQDS